jgi:hypothetical protein
MKDAVNSAQCNLVGSVSVHRDCEQNLHSEVKKRQTIFGHR